MKNTGNNNANSITDQTIEELIERFEQAQLEQSRVITELRSRVSANTREQHEGSRTTTNSSTVLDESTDDLSDRSNPRGYERKYSRYFKPSIGDTIRIVNLNGGQHNKGRIRGFCRDGKARVDTGVGSKLVDRTISNIVFTTRPDNGLREQDGRYYYQH